MPDGRAVYIGMYDCGAVHGCMMPSSPPPSVAVVIDEAKNVRWYSCFGAVCGCSAVSQVCPAAVAAGQY